jgi:hypothetical protein
VFVGVPDIETEQWKEALAKSKLEAWPSLWQNFSSSFAASPVFQG